MSGRRAGPVTAPDGREAEPAGGKVTRPGPGMEAARAVLHRHFGHPDFRPAQAPVVAAVLAGRDVLAVLPTGAGKSVCFQVPAMLSPGVTVVVSPLISLMDDQVAGARRRGIPAGALTSQTSTSESRRAVEALRSGRLRLLYVSPERLSAAGLRRTLAGVRVSRLAVDEAHCISEWGHDFRPEYREIPEAYPFLGIPGRIDSPGDTSGARAVCRRRRPGDRGERPPVTAFTATATPETRRDVADSLQLEDPAVFVAGVDRPNLRWGATRARSLGEAARNILEVEDRGPARGASVVYVPTRARAVRMAAAFRRRGMRARPYHAGLPGELRRRTQEAFLSGRVRILCATSAFGMGIDHPEVRRVCHLGIPGSLEAYVQEAGRAGRDGEPAVCLLVRHPGDDGLQRALVTSAWPPPRLVRRVWRALPPGRAVEAAEAAACCRRLGRAPDTDAVGAALRMLERFGCVRSEAGGTAVESEAPLRYTRGPDVLSGRIDPEVVARGRRRALRRLDAMVRYSRTRGCRRAAIAGYFGERAPTCRGCDRCDRAGGGC